MQFDTNTIVIAACFGLLLLFIIYLACQSESADAFPRKNGMFMPRKPTDKGFGICFAVCLGIMAFILVRSFQAGNPKRLTRGVDWKGRVCGEDDTVKDKPFLYFCGSPERSAGTQFPKYIMQGSTTCISACPKDALQKFECLYPAFHNFTVYNNKTALPGGLLNKATLDLTVTQSLVNQASYPSELFGGSFCVPDSKKNPSLHEVVVNGPFARHIRPWLAFGSLRDAVFLLGLSALLSVICSFAYFQLLKKCAGLVIFGTMVFAALLLAAIGALMLWVIFLDPTNPPKDYAQINPIFSVYEGAEAKVYSVITGMVLLMACGIIALLAFTSLAHIDEMVGLIDAALECTNKNQVFSTTYPLVQSGIMIALFYFMVLSLGYVASVAEKDNARIKVDGVDVLGLQEHWVRKWYDNYATTFYVVCCWWILEIYIQWANFIIAYVVSSWYFVPTLAPTLAQNNMGNLTGTGTGKHVNVRVGGVDQNYGPREGVVMHDNKGQRMLVVPVGKKAPGLGRYNVGEQEVNEKPSTNMKDIGWLFSANAAIISSHLGSIALGAPVIAILRPFRLFSQCLSGCLARSAPDPIKGAYDTHPGNSNIKGCFALFSACLDQVVGKFSKNAYVELVLAGGHSGSGEGFFDACDESFKFLVTCGGSVAYLHGAMLAYEAVGCICITVFCGWTVLVVQDKVDWFNEPASGWYIEDKNASVLAACVVAFIVSYAYMALWNQTADTLLYCVAWNRKQCHLGHEFDIHGHQAINPPAKVCPQALRYLIPAYELEAHYEDGVHAHGVGQMGAIIAAMEHGAMSSKGAPNYSNTMGSVFQTGAKMGNF